MTVRLIVIDLDETLLKKDKTYDVERFNHALSELKNRGVVVCIATGNSYHKIIDYFSVEDQKDLYFACDNGNFIIKNDEELGSKKIASQTLYDISEFMDEFDGFNIVVNTGHHAYFRENEGPIFETISKYNNVLGYVQSFEEIPEGEQATKMAVYSEHSLDRNKTMVRIIKERYDDVTAVTSGDGWLDVYHAEGGKGSAVRKLQEKYQIKPEESMAFGDSLNDESMMQEVKYSIAMGNADRDLLLSTKYQIGTNEEQAVIDVLEKLVASDSEDFMDKYLTHKK
ncbi:Cof-type HAD-IIB family hydrolase [Aerococcaceae bacterium WGS1372]